MSREACPGAAPGEAAGQPAATRATPAARNRGDGARLKRPSLGGGGPAQGRELRAQGRQTVSRLLEAGLAEFDERGFQAVRVDDIVRRARTSHGTFYLYFANKEDLFKALLRDALHDMAGITDAFPVVTRNAAGRAALRQWVHTFCETYAAHSAVIRSLSQAELIGEEVWGDGLQLLFRLSEAMTQGMTAAAGEKRPERAGGPAQASADGHRPGLVVGGDGEGDGDGGESLAGHAELTALACLMMLERVNYLWSVEVRLPREEMVDRLTAIMFAAFQSP